MAQKYGWLDTYLSLFSLAIFVGYQLKEIMKYTKEFLRIICSSVLANFFCSHVEEASIQSSFSVDTKSKARSAIHPPSHPSFHPTARLSHPLPLSFHK